MPMIFHVLKEKDFSEVSKAALDITFLSSAFAFLISLS